MASLAKFTLIAAHSTYNDIGLRGVATIISGTVCGAIRNKYIFS